MATSKISEHGWYRCGKVADLIGLGKDSANDIGRILGGMGEDAKRILRGLAALGLWTDDMAASILPDFGAAVYRKQIRNTLLTEAQWIDEYGAASKETSGQEGFSTAIFRLHPSVAEASQDTGDAAFHGEIRERANAYFQKLLDADDGESFFRYCFYRKIWAGCIARLTDDAEALMEQYKTYMARKEPGDVAWDLHREIDEIFFARMNHLAATHRTTTLSVSYVFIEQQLGMAMSHGDNMDCRRAPLVLESVYEKFLKTLGEENEYTLSALHDKAELAFFSGDKLEAAKLTERYLGLARKVYGDSDERTLDAMRELVRLYDDLRRSGDALRLEEEILALYRKKFGDTGEETLEWMRSMALRLDRAGRGEEARALREEVLAARKKTIREGKAHIDRLDRAALEQIFDAADEAYFLITLDLDADSEEALALKDEVLQICHQVLGTENEAMFDVLDDMAWTQVCSSQWDAVITMREKILAIRIQNCGEDDERTIHAMEKLAEDIEAWAEPDWREAHSGAARKIRERILRLRREQARACLRDFGETHERTLDALDTLARCHEGLGQGEETLKIREAILAVKKRTCGADSADTLEAMERVAEAMDALGRTEASRQVKEEIFAIRGENLRQYIDWAIEEAESVAFGLWDLERHDEAIRQWQDILALGRARFGEDDGSILPALDDLAYHLHECGRYEEEMPLLREKLEWIRAHDGEESPETASAMLEMAKAMEALRQYGDVAELWKRAGALRERQLGKGHRDTVLARHLSVYFLSLAGRYSEALDMQRETMGRFTEEGEARGEVITLVEAVEVSFLVEALFALSRYEEDWAAALRGKALELLGELKECHAAWNPICRLSFFDPSQRVSELVFEVRDGLLAAGYDAEAANADHKTGNLTIAMNFRKLLHDAKAKDTADSAEDDDASQEWLWDLETAAGGGEDIHGLDPSAGDKGLRESILEKAKAKRS